MSQSLRYLGLFSLIMITVGSVDSIRNLPATALFGSSVISFFVLAAIFFLLPCALVAAELSSAWTDEGGVYVWVREAFGRKWGFFAIWFQWIENVIWYPTILSFIAGTVGYLVSPALATNKYFLVGVILVVFWGITFLNLYGMKSSAWFASFCSMTGLVLPMVLIIALGLIWFFSGKPAHIAFSWHSILPVHASNMWVSLTGIMLSFCGMEIATVHVHEARDPQKTYPLALLYSTLFILVTLLLGSLAIAIVLPHSVISLVAGIMQAFTAFFHAYHLAWLLPVVAIMLVLGGLGGVNNWVIAPTRGLRIAGKDGNLPQHLSAANRHGAPGVLLLIQAIIVTCLTLVFLFMPSVNGSYWLLTALAAQLYMLMYILMFIAGFYLRLKQGQRPRAFRIPGGLWGIGIVVLLGVISAVVTFAVGFVPPAGVDVGGAAHYEKLILLGLVIMTLPPCFVAMKKR